jgi:hypothetical protein
MAAFWDVVLCGLVKLTEVSEVFTASIISIYQTTWCNIPEDSIFTLVAMKT